MNVIIRLTLVCWYRFPSLLCTRSSIYIVLPGDIAGRNGLSCIPCQDIDRVKG